MENINKIIAKYLSNQGTAEEIDRLTELIGESNNERVFEEYVRINYAVEYNMTEFDINKAKKKLLRRIRKDKNIFYLKRFQNTLKYAAVITIILFAGYFYQHDYFISNSNKVITPKDESITLELENGMIEVINPDTSKEIRDSQGNIVGNQQNDQITYSGITASEELIYNKLTVPYGKRFNIQLSDGTQVYLNSGTVLKFPVKFLPGKDRHVYLHGEAYFDVVKDKVHPFRVKADKLNVEVLGTEFNVQAYEEDSTTDVVLVEGSVALFSGESTSELYKLQPGERGVYQRDNGQILSENVNTTVYTAWRRGELVFRNMNFQNIILKLERHYNVKIENKNEALNKEIFNASFNNESLENVLGYFQDITDMTYKVKGHSIYIR